MEGRFLIVYAQYELAEEAEAIEAKRERGKDEKKSLLKCGSCLPERSSLDWAEFERLGILV